MMPQHFHTHSDDLDGLPMIPDLNAPGNTFLNDQQEEDEGLLLQNHQ
jgi:hypothetical protein